MHLSSTTPLTKLEPADWQGTAGARWAANVDHFETMLTSVGAALLAHAGFAPGERVVEIGCGGGGLTRLLADEVAPDGRVVGLDISPLLVDLATQRACAAAVENIAFEVADAQLGQPSEAPFDRLVSRFGVMFFADPAAAMVNLHTMLKPGGRLDFAVWAAIADNPWAGTMMEASRAHLGIAPPDPRGPGPFAFSDADYLRSLLDAAGFTAITFTAWSGMVRIGQLGATPEEVATLSMATGSLAEPLKEAGEELRAKVQATLIGLLAPYMTPEGAVLPASVHLVTAVA